jgi:predicted MPP superfamily phosphohydrolase
VSRFLFLPVVFGLIYGIHYYIWVRLVRDTALPPPFRGVATGLLVALALSLPLTFLVGRAVKRETAGLFAWPAFVWMGLMMMLLLLLLGADVVRAAARVARGPVEDPLRRLFLHRLLGGAVATVAAGAAVVAIRQARRLALRDLTIPLSRLPRAFDGTRIVQLTDIHVGPTLGREFIEDLVARTNALEPDLVAITGDLVDGSVAHLRDAVAPLAQLRARHGVYFVTGNHEYYSGVDEWLDELRRLGVRVLRNERVAIGGPNSDDGFDLAGVDDHSASMTHPDHGPDLPRALEGRDPSRELVLLAHQPRAIHEAARHGVGLQLSGHTHGGQIWPWRYLVRLQQPYVAGLIRHGDTHLYISAGTGYWGPPMRLGTTAEITRLTLRRA